MTYEKNGNILTTKLSTVECQQQKEVFSIELQRVDPLHEQVYRKLDDDIIQGVLLPGEKIIESKIALELNVSRSPVREAIRKLEQDGLLVNVNNTVKVFQPSIDDIIELYEMRIALEPLACYWATKNSTDEFINKLKNILAKTKKALEMKDINTIVQCNSSFHELIYLQSKNSKLYQTLFNIRKLIKFSRNTLLKNSNRTDSFFEEHNVILKTIISNNPILARSTMEDHLMNDLASLLQIEGFSTERALTILNEMRRW